MFNFNMLHFIQNTRRLFPKTSEKFKRDDVRFVVSVRHEVKIVLSELTLPLFASPKMSSVFNELNQKLALLSVTGLAAILGLNSFRGFIHHSRIVS